MKKMATPAAMLLISFLCSSFKPVYFSKEAYYIVIDKSDYELTVYNADGWLVVYPVVFGKDDLGDKMMQGDFETPEGTFSIISKRIHPGWKRFMGIDYPTKESIQKFNERKAAGIIPKNAKIGGDIGIHGTWMNEDFKIDNYDNWTEGCISMRNADVIELYNMIPEGTKVIIRK